MTSSSAAPTTRSSTVTSTTTVSTTQRPTTSNTPSTSSSTTSRPVSTTTTTRTVSTTRSTPSSTTQSSTSPSKTTSRITTTTVSPTFVLPLRPAISVNSSSNSSSLPTAGTTVFDVNSTAAQMSKGSDSALPNSDAFMNVEASMAPGTKNVFKSTTVAEEKLSSQSTTPGGVATKTPLKTTKRFGLSTAHAVDLPREISEHLLRQQKLFPKLTQQRLLRNQFLTHLQKKNLGKIDETLKKFRTATTPFFTTRFTRSTKAESQTTTFPIRSTRVLTRQGSEPLRIEESHPKSNTAERTPSEFLPKRILLDENKLFEKEVDSKTLPTSSPSTDLLTSPLTTSSIALPTSLLTTLLASSSTSRSTTPLPEPAIIDGEVFGNLFGKSFERLFWI